MRKLLPFVIVVILVLGGLGASALTIEKDNNENKKYYNSERATHTVLAEYGTATHGVVFVNMLMVL